MSALHKSHHDRPMHYDLVVIGATPGGIGAALSASRLGQRVALTAHHHIGGMMTSGLGKSDIENKGVLGGVFKEFTGRVFDYYRTTYGDPSPALQKCRQGYYYEPSVAEKVLLHMLQEAKTVDLHLNCQLHSVRMEGNLLVEVSMIRGEENQLLSLTAPVFIDATYEGDLMAKAGAKYRLGRESRSEFGEAHAGQIFVNHTTKEIHPAGSGQGDDHLPAYTFRLCLTDDPQNSLVLKKPPAGYDRSRYLAYFNDLQEGRLSRPEIHKDGHGYYSAHYDTMMRVFSFAEIPNRKYDVNINPRALGFPFIGENRHYVEANWAQRELVYEKHKELVLGLLYFVQNDPEVSEGDRALAARYHLPLDEFQDNDHFPYQLYVREARRLLGQYTLTENDFCSPASERRSTVFEDSIACGEFPLDSFPVTKATHKGQEVLEGYICMLEIAPYQVPLRCIIPKGIEGIMVPVAASTSHVAFSTIRMEPLWMNMGQAAGMVGGLANQKHCKITEVPVTTCQHHLLEAGQILTYFKDQDHSDKASKAAQFWGTKGFFSTYLAELRKPLTKIVARSWMDIFVDLTPATTAIPQEISKPNAMVSISDFLYLTQRMIHQHGLERKSEENIEQVLRNSLYQDRSFRTAMLRGEACLAWYDLHFLILKNTSHDDA